MNKLWRKPLDSKQVKVPVGLVHIIDDRCKGCGFCIEYCPRSVLVESARFNTKGYHPPDVDKPDSCVNCGLCELICPEFAIFSTLREEREANHEGV